MTAPATRDSNPNGPCKQYRILLVEDMPDDAEIVLLALRNAPFAIVSQRVETEAAYLAALAERPDVILCDYKLPRFSVDRALQILRERGDDIPVIVVSGQIGEDAAVEALRSGASDYMLKDRLGRLPTAILSAIERANASREKAAAAAALASSEAHKQAILNALESRIVLLDGAGVIIAANRAWERFGADLVSGFDHSCGIGTNYLEYLADNKAAWDASAMAHDHLRAVLGGAEKRFSMDYQLPLRGGNRSFVVRIFALDGGAPGAVVAHQDISDRVMSQVALRDANDQLRALSKRVLRIQDEERRAISRELHDDLGQSLTALKIGLHMIATLPEAARAAKLDEAITIAEASLNKLRQMSVDLHPPQLDQLGLPDALAWLAERQASATGMTIECSSENVETRLPPDLESACFRIVQEALSNAARHAKAKRVIVRLEKSGNLLQLSIQDDGVGFQEDNERAKALQRGSLGLISMEERAQLAGGRLKLRSVVGSGTTLSVTFPLAQGGPREALS